MLPLFIFSHSHSSPPLPPHPLPPLPPPLPFVPAKMFKHMHRLSFQILSAFVYGESSHPRQPAVAAQATAFLTGSTTLLSASALEVIAQGILTSLSNPSDTPLTFLNDFQRLFVLQVLQLETDLVVIAPCGSGKTMGLIVAAHQSRLRGQVVVAFAPQRNVILSLASQLVAVGLVGRTFNEGDSNIGRAEDIGDLKCDVLFFTAEQLCSNRDALPAIQNLARLDRVSLVFCDEVHLHLSSQAFRKAFQGLGPLALRLPGNVHVVYTTATLACKAERAIRDVLMLKANCVVMRSNASLGRGVRCDVEGVHAGNAVERLGQLVGEWLSVGADLRGRMLILVMGRAVAELLRTQILALHISAIKESDVGVITSHGSNEDIEAVLKSKNLIIATSLVTTSANIDDLRLVVAFRDAHNLGDLTQLFGRLARGRDAQGGRFVLLFDAQYHEFRFGAPNTAKAYNVDNISTSFLRGVPDEDVLSQFGPSGVHAFAHLQTCYMAYLNHVFTDTGGPASCKEFDPPLPLCSNCRPGDMDTGDTSGEEEVDWCNGDSGEHTGAVHADTVLSMAGSATRKEGGEGEGAEDSGDDAWLEAQSEQIEAAFAAAADNWDTQKNHPALSDTTPRRGLGEGKGKSVHPQPAPTLSAGPRLSQSKVAANLADRFPQAVGPSVAAAPQPSGLFPSKAMHHNNPILAHATKFLLAFEKLVADHRTLGEKGKPRHCFLCEYDNCNGVRGVEGGKAKQLCPARLDLADIKTRIQACFLCGGRHARSNCLAGDTSSVLAQKELRCASCWLFSEPACGVRFHVHGGTGQGQRVICDAIRDGSRGAVANLWWSSVVKPTAGPTSYPLWDGFVKYTERRVGTPPPTPIRPLVDSPDWCEAKPRGPALYNDFPVFQAWLHNECHLGLGILNWDLALKYMLSRTV